MIDITPIINAGILLVATIVSIAVVPKVRAYLSAKYSNEELAEFERIIRTLVQAAEQIYKGMPKSGENKKQYVLDILKNEYGYEVDTDEVDAFIEATVNELFGNKEGAK